jgi:maltose alpha-D-glucosyltransferase/alpha-amylase
MWHHDAVLYQIAPRLFLDTDGDGCGDLRGIERQLEYVRELGASTVWLQPFYRSPFRDDGYDITDHFAVDPRLGTIGDFVRLMERADSLGLRVLVELVMQHTSDQHPWFQAARRDRNSPFRDYYIWSDEPVDDGLEPVFPTVEKSVWTWDEVAGQFYRHMFYSHEPDLELGNPRVRAEMYRIMSYWLRLGVAGFRVDAVRYMIERACAANPQHDGLWLLEHMHHHATQRAPGAIIMGEADVAVHRYEDYFGNRDRLTHLLDFWTNNHVFLSLARQSARPLLDALQHGDGPELRKRHVVWLRNHDELNLMRLSQPQQDEVMAAFAPEPSMRVYERGIRRRPAPMLEEEARLAMAHALVMSMPGLPVLRYGDEIGMGENLDLPEREAVRTPMQWSAAGNGGFSDAPEDHLVAPVIDDPDFAPARINVESQRWDPRSLLSRVRAMIDARVALPEIGECWREAKLDDDRVLGLRYDDAESGMTLLVLVNLSDQPLTLRVEEADLRGMVEVLRDADYDGDVTLSALALRPYGYRWLRSRQVSAY